jgi:protein phosphatase
VAPSKKTIPDGSDQLTPPPLPLTIEAAWASHAGQVREINEDVCGIFTDLRFFVIADGMGGHSAGEIAAQIAVDALETFHRENQSADRPTWPFPMDPRFSLPVNLMRVGFKVANQRIREESVNDPAWHRMGATAAALTFDEEQLVAGHTGDVRIYRYRRDHLSRLTRDHSLFEEMRVARPDLSEAEIETIAPRNVVTRALGTKLEVEATVRVNSYLDQDIYLICSDGLWGAVSDAEIARLLGTDSDLDSRCLALIDAANQAGGSDNISLILIRVRR